METKRAKISFLTINDVYEMSPVKDVGGLSQVATMLEEERSKLKSQGVDHVFTTVNGDFLVCTSISALVRGRQMIEVLNSLKTDFVVPGNHEFDFGPEELKARVQESQFTWLSSNIFESDQKTLFAGFTENKIVEIGNGIKVGFFGVCTDEVNFLSHPGDTVFKDVIEISKKQALLLKAQGAQVVVALTHQYLPEDTKLAREVPEIDLIMGGHDHTPSTFFEGGTLLHKSGMNAQWLGRIDVSVEVLPSAAQPRIDFSWEMIRNRGFSEHLQTAEIIQKYSTQLQNLRQKHLCVFKSDMESLANHIRSRECSMGNLITDICRSVFHDADVCIIQAGSIRGNEVYRAGTKFSEYDLNRECPFPNHLSYYTLSGASLKQALEEGLRGLPASAGCFPQVSGMQIGVITENPPEKRVAWVKIGGQPLDLEKTYKVVSTAFIKKGGDGFRALAEGVLIPHPQNDAVVSQVLQDGLARMKEVSATVEGRIQMLDASSEQKKKIFKAEKD